MISSVFNALALNRMITNMEKILTTLENSKVNKIVVVNIAPFGNHVNYIMANGVDETISRYNQWLQTYAITHHYGYVDQFTAFKDPADFRKLNITYDQGDGLHLNAAGQSSLADMILVELDRVLQ